MRSAAQLFDLHIAHLRRKAAHEGKPLYLLIPRDGPVPLGETEESAIARYRPRFMEWLADVHIRAWWQEYGRRSKGGKLRGEQRRLASHQNQLLVAAATIELEKSGHPRYGLQKAVARKSSLPLSYVRKHSKQIDA